MLIFPKARHERNIFFYQYLHISFISFMLGCGGKVALSIKANKMH